MDVVHHSLCSNRVNDRENGIGLPRHANRPSRIIGKSISVIGLELFCCNRLGLELCACPLDYIKRGRAPPCNISYKAMQWKTTSQTRHGVLR